MFFPFHLTVPEASEALHRRVLAWCRNERRSIYLAGESKQGSASNPLERRFLTEADLTLLERHLNRAEHYLEFGGVVGGQELDEINGLCFFTVSESGEQARLTAFVSNDKLALDGSPLQSPLLLLPLAALLRQVQTVESFYLPFHEIWQEDFIRVALYYFAPASEEGWWQQANTQAELAELLAFSPAEPVESWLEVSLPVEADVLDYVSRLFSRCGYQQRLLIEQGRPAGENGEEAVLAVVHTYLPAGDVANSRLEELAESLSSLSALRPLDKICVRERSSEYWHGLWNDPHLFRVGQQILLTPDRKNISPGPGEVVVEIPPSTEVFSLGPTGPHVTTALCLQMLEKHFDPAFHSQLLDLGTGSGTLAIVAVYLGAKKVLALDAFRPAVELARLNILRNEVSDRVQVEAGSLSVYVKKDRMVYAFKEEAQLPPSGLAEWLPFDAIVSNTFAHVLSGLAVALFEALRPGGLLVTSGILKQNAGEVLRAFEASGLALFDRLEDDTWTSFAHVRPA